MNALAERRFGGAGPASYSGGTVHLAVDGPIATITINRPEVRNAIGPAVIDGLREAASVLAPDDAVRAVVVTGAGGHFSAGADINVAAEQTDEAKARRWIRFFRAGLRDLSTLPQPVVAAIEGYALGGGCELALWCDLRVVSCDAQLGVPEVKIGLLPAAGGTQLLPRLIGRSLALELLLLGDPISGARAKEIGLALAAVPEGQALAAATDVARRLAGLSPLAMRAVKEAVKAEWMPLEQALDEELRLGAELFSTEDRQEGLAAFLEKRPPRFQSR